MDTKLARITRSRALPYWLRLKLVNWLRPVGCPAAFEAASFGSGFEGLRYRGNPGTLIDGHIFYLGMYEPSTLDFLQTCVRRVPDLAQRTFLDIGAHTGLFTLHGANLFSRVYAFEPYPPNFARLQEHVGINNLNNVNIFQFGLGDTDTILPFKPPATDNDSIGSFFLAKKEGNAARSKGNNEIGSFASMTGEGGNSVLLRVRRGDDVLQEFQTVVGLIKIDVEGFEPEVLTGLRQTIYRDRPPIIMELTWLTKSAFGNYDKLVASLPPNYTIQAVQRKTNNCILTKLDWERKQENIVAIPEELSKSIIS